MITCFSWSVLHFNSHAHVERDIDSRNNHIVEKNFNSHAHVERDLDTGLSIIGIHISTHTLTWSVTCILQALWRYNRNFNSHAHVERDEDILHSRRRTSISTHTLTWSVTADGVQARSTCQFQLTRSRGA